MSGVTRSAVLLVCVLVLIYQCSECVCASPVFDEELYVSVLNQTLCKQTLAVLAIHSRHIALKLLDASGRVPRGVLQGNLVDYGDYFECLGIDEEDHWGHRVQGKHCLYSVGINASAGQAWGLAQAVEVPGNRLTRLVSAMSGKSTQLNQRLTLGACIPRECSLRDALQALPPLPGALSVLSNNVTVGACRLPNDRPWVAVDIVTLVVFSVLALLVLMSSSYELIHIFGVANDKKALHPIYASFSVVRNSRRVLDTGSLPPDSILAADGVRALSMGWVVLGHAFSTDAFFSPISNGLDALEWIDALSSVYVMAARFAVDSFFMLSGLMLVYTVTRRYNTVNFVRNVCWLYIHRLVRVLPLLAATLLLHSSLLAHAADGPHWASAAGVAANCRERWWYTLLMVNNYFDDLTNSCMGQTWYLAVDTQLYFLSPLVLYWLLDGAGKRGRAWPALLLPLLLTVVATAAISAIYQLPFSPFDSDKLGLLSEYMRQYYKSTLCRAPPFVVGMAAGYCLHMTRGSTVQITQMWSWCLTALCLSTLVGLALSERLARAAWAAAALNAGGRAAWAAALAGLIVLAQHGHARCVGWVLSWRAWRVVARLSYAMYLLHMQLMIVVRTSRIQPQRFRPADTVYRALSDGCVSLAAAFVLTLLVDAPITTLFNQVMKRITEQKKSESQDTQALILEDKEPPEHQQKLIC